MAVRVTQEGVEVSVQPSPKGRLGQCGAEALVRPTAGPVRMTQDGAEVLVAASAGKGRVTLTGLEVLVKR